MDLRLRTLFKGQAPVPLTTKVFDILEIFVRSAGSVIDKSTIMTALWPDTVVEESNITNYVFILRKALGESPGDHRFIVTVTGRGYRFVAEVWPEPPMVPTLVEPVPPRPEWKWKLIAAILLIIVIALALSYRR